MQKINVNLFPKSGYVFKDQKGVTHVGASWADVIRKVVAYRKRQGQPVGGVIKEVMEQACRNNPAYCHEESVIQIQQYRKVSLKGKVLHFLARARESKKAGALHFVNPVDASHRADVCVRCPFNQALPGGCGSCTKARRAAQKEVLGESRRLDERLNGCLILGEDLGVAVHLERVTVDVPELPAHCWRKKTL